ncbi:hypothetical protein ColLi_10951 [Colletotrichum liriopes]|uniref:Uncharacterized protein n=1 Tax=Colletotrichum liriopes TaxID=708192 RepID=A0AA37GVL3_9PEZI|nr:hypothetical protein ColLi_10951 [Colletotrichum liriopes]
MQDIAQQYTHLFTSNTSKPASYKDIVEDNRVAEVQKGLQAQAEKLLPGPSKDTDTSQGEQVRFDTNRDNQA